MRDLFLNGLPTIVARDLCSPNRSSEFSAVPHGSMQCETLSDTFQNLLKPLDNQPIVCQECDVSQQENSFFGLQRHFSGKQRIACSETGFTYCRNVSSCC